MNARCVCKAETEIIVGSAGLLKSKSVCSKTLLTQMDYHLDLWNIESHWLQLLPGLETQPELKIWRPSVNLTGYTGWSIVICNVIPTLSSWWWMCIAWQLSVKVSSLGRRVPMLMIRGERRGTNAVEEEEQSAMFISFWHQSASKWQQGSLHHWCRRRTCGISSQWSRCLSTGILPGKKLSSAQLCFV